MWLYENNLIQCKLMSDYCKEKWIDDIDEACKEWVSIYWSRVCNIITWGEYDIEKIKKLIYDK